MVAPIRICSSVLAALAIATTLPSVTFAQDFVDIDISDIDLQDITFTDIFSNLPSKSFNGNKAIDRLLNVLSRLVPNHVKVPDLKTDMNLHDCFIEGLSSSIVRAGDVALNVTGQTIALSFGLALNDISLKCSWKRKVLVLTLIGTTKVDASKIEVSAAISVNLQPGSHPEVIEFRVLNLDGLKASFTGLGFLNKLADRLSDVVIQSSRQRITSEIEEKVTKKLQDSLNRLKVPQF